MKLPNGSVLMHTDSDGIRHAYDPIKAHEYYIRTRRLRGRKRATDDAQAQTLDAANATASAKSMGQVRIRNSFAVRGLTGRTTYLNAQQLAQRKAAVEKKVQSIQKKLTELNKALKEKIADAKRSEREASKPRSAAERARAARESRRYRDKNQQRIRNQRQARAARDKAEGKSGSSVEKLRASIDNAKRSLAEAIAQQKALSGATKNG